MIDDFAPAGTTQDVARMHREADRVIRAQGNSAGRARLRADGSLRKARPPRGLILGTGEEVPRGHSIRARLLVIELSSGDVDRNVLSDLQVAAREGRHALVMAGFLRHLAPGFADLQSRRPDDVARLRARATAGSSAHRRTPEIVANLAFGWETFLNFAQHVGAVTPDEALELERTVWSVLGAAAEAQESQQAAADPVTRSLDLLAALISSGRVHIASTEGFAPDEASAWGWRSSGLSELEPMGRRIGWVHAQNLFLEPNASYAEVNRLAGEQGETFPIDTRTWRKRLDQRGLLVSRGERDLTVRRYIEGKRRRVLHLSSDAVFATAPHDSRDDFSAARDDSRDDFSEASRPTETRTSTGIAAQRDEWDERNTGRDV